ncbi:hypothetical protein ES703_68088 [subsurface metagenome]
MKLQEAKKKYKGEWLAFLVVKEIKGKEVEGRVLAHTKDRRLLHQILRDKRVKNAYITYAGPMVKPGYAVMF